MPDTTAAATGREPRPATGPGAGPGAARPAVHAAVHATGRRPAPDGIRAVAVLAVAVYHFGGGGSSWLRGGFLGVDVFFVLSGYLITGLLLAEHARTGGIRLGAFWLRRVRRLLPALLVVLLAVSAWTWWAGAPDSYPRRRGDLWWTVAYLANWHAVSVSEDYFAAYTGASPLRHAWSLAVEEQFYLVWPALLLGLLLLGRRVTRLRVLVPGVIAASIPVSALLMAAEYVPDSPTRAYYGTEGRVQQLMVGALLAWALPRMTARTEARSAAGGAAPGSGRGGRWTALLTPGGWAAAGLLLLLVGFVLMDDVAPLYYRGGALLVGLAAVALLGGVELAPAGAVARLLSARPAVALGRISYGVYLWHWPVTVALPVAGYPLRDQVARQLLRVLLTLVAATLSYLLVERPVLERAWWRPARRLVPAAVLATALVTAVGVQATALPAGIAHQLAVSSDRPCPGEAVDRLVSCLRAGPDRAPVDLMLVGDSVARSLGPGLDAWASATGSSWAQAAWQRCPPTGLLVLPGGVVDPPAAACAEQATAEIDRALQRWRPTVVLAAEFWTHHQQIEVDGRVLQPGSAEQDAAVEAAYDRLADRVAAVGGTLVLLHLVPGGDTLGTVVARGRPAEHGRPPVPGDRYVAGWNALLDRVAADRPGTVRVVDIRDLVCDPGGDCPAVRDGVLVRTDGVHYSVAFSQRLGPQLMARVEAAVQPSSLPR